MVCCVWFVLCLLQRGLQRCKNNFLRPCTRHSNCSEALAGDTCLFDVPTFSSLRDVLLLYAEVGLPNLQDLVRRRR